MENSHFITTAKDIISSVKGKLLSVEERREKAIELAALMLNEARRIQSNKERRIQKQLARMMNDEVGKVFTTSLTDQCFRSQKTSRVGDQLVHVINTYGIPKFLTWDRQLGLGMIKIFGRILPQVLVPLTKHMLRSETSQVILPGESDKLAKHMQQRRKENVRINLNHLGEAILGEKEAKHRLHVYLDDLAKPNVEYISIKISTIYSQINLLAWENTLEMLIPRLKMLYRAAKENLYTRSDGTKTPKFVNLDMEEYRDLHYTVDLFRRVLDDPEFYHHSAGIVLQSYLPDSHLIQQELTVWAMKRVANGGAPITIRIVKGANLAMEQVEASLRGWPQAPYTNKADVDANYKRMLIYGSVPQHAKAANLGIASHNLFDIAYGLLLRSENNIEPYVCFEMLEGMADHMRRVVQELSGGMLLYCPAATKEEFQNAVAYLVRRLDENTAPENFLRHAFELIPGTKEWQKQSTLFSDACHMASTIGYTPRRFQNRFLTPSKVETCCAFENEPDTDWALAQNRKWAEAIIKEWATKTFPPIPLQIGGELIHSKNQATSTDPSIPGKTLYTYSLADISQVDRALDVAVEAQKGWEQTPITERAQVLANAAHEMRLNRNNLIGVMVANGGKTVYEADVEISEAIDFADYYARNLVELSSLEDVSFKAKGVVLVTPPWNFPCSIPSGGITAALAAGNSVIFKPAPEAVLTGWELVQLLWKAGFSKKVLQFVTCEDDPVGIALIKDPRVSTVVLTGATATAKLFMRIRPGLDLIAETGGKNAMIISALSDRDLAIKDLIQSAFGHAGQKCSACSLAICEAEVYDDPNFREHLRDAAESLKVGSAWDLSTKVNPLIQAPNPTLFRGLTQLDDEETWLLEPKQDPKNPGLWSPGIKLGVKPGSYSHQTEFFGPVLSVMRAENLKQAVELANGTPYGLTSGLQSLDDREQKYWMDNIESGNCYINRGITGAIVQRQPFGGCKESCFGKGSKAGGPNYLMQLMTAEQKELPQLLELPKEGILALGKHVDSKDKQIWDTSIGSYAFFWNHYFSKDQDPSLVQGQDNLLRYVPQKQMTLRISKIDHWVDVLRVVAATMTCRIKLEISSEMHLEALKGLLRVNVVAESEAAFIERLEREKIKRVRLLNKPSLELTKALAENACNVVEGPVLANGRLELVHYLREVSFSIDYHRYGNLGIREKEGRAIVPAVATSCCGGGKCCRK